MSAFEVGRKLVDFCKKGENDQALAQLYSNEIVSVEPIPNEQGKKEVVGLDAVRAKNTWWLENHEIHSAEVQGPFPHGDQFCVFFKFDVTPKGGQRMTMEETALYTTNGDKITKEQFFYNMG